MSEAMQALVANARLGYSLEQQFYTSEAVFKADMERVIGRKWLVAGHVSRIPNKGDYFLFRIGAEQIIVIRESEASVRAFFNVCRHRGSTICAADSGNAPRLVCPYHAWTFGLDGRLLAARLMPEDFDKAENGLFTCHIRVFHGLVFINLSADEPDDFDATFGDVGPILEYHGLADARIAHAGSYPTDANWKLVVENFFECYHCVPSHPEFCSIHAAESIVAVGAGPSSGPADAIASFAPKLQAWEASAAALGRPIGTIDEPPTSSHLRLLMQRMNKPGWASETQDGTPPAPLMGQRTAPDGGRMHLSFSPFSQIVADDHFVILFQFTPRSALRSDVEMIWLVDGRASEAEVDLAKMTWGYHATTTQDKVITEANQAGIMSSRYQPGRYSDQEGSVINFQQWYLNHFGPAAEK
ncbi:aromatic ring-hydroxylating dioxygenase subunit alpha [Novosphingobium sp.]|uniref:aromatic ring-hydroxylating oxygenase subunit alpha n=1 Tax=Novosphingobium sp. TaxID=1874826 RepID=UPI0025F3A49A|nr:aromatic ring-hydroxylating dioxygenase subunit alpha [Novosphingobium sp.]